jgi:hypothetical protein
MKEIKVKVYSFNELSDDAKEKAIQSLSDVNVDYRWWNDIYEDATDIGLKITSFDLDRNRHAEGAFLLSANEVAQNILNSHGEDCETFKTATTFLKEWQPIFADYVDEESDSFESHESEDELLELEDEFLNSILEDYSIILQNEAEYLQSEESIIETIEANGFVFLKNGKQFFE